VATDWAPMMVLAPGLFSITTETPSVSRICSARTRVATSVGPPAAYGTTIVIGREGKAWARAADRPMLAAMDEASRHRREIKGIVVLPV
jgi:hypothetical protein